MNFLGFFTGTATQSQQPIVEPQLKQEPPQNPTSKNEPLSSSSLTIVGGYFQNDFETMLDKCDTVANLRMKEMIVDDEMIKKISNFTNLTELFFEKCYNLTDDHISTIVAQKKSQLKSLTICGCDQVDSYVYKTLIPCVALKSIKVKGVYWIQDDDFDELAKTIGKDLSSVKIGHPI